VVTDVGDAAHIVSDTGVVVPPEQPPALAAGMAAMLERIERDGRDAGGAACRHRVLAQFDLARMVQAYTAVWRRISGDEA